MYKNNNETEFIFDGAFTPYTVVNNYIFEDDALSLQAKGLYCSIVRWQNSPNHIITVRGLMKTCKNGRDSIQKTLKELIEHGFLSTIQLRDEKGHFKGVKYRVYTKPITPETLETVYVNPNTENPNTDNPNTKKPQHKTKIEKKENKNNYNMIDDKVTKNEVENHQSSSNINNEYVDTFLVNYCDAMGQDYILTDKEKIEITHLFNRYGEKAVLRAIDNIRHSQWLQDNNTPFYFINQFIGIFNNQYKKHTIDKTSTVKYRKTGFTIMDSREWDFEELDRLEDAYIARKLGKRYRGEPIEQVQLDDRKKEIIEKYTTDNLAFAAYLDGEISKYEYEWLKTYKF